MNNSKERLVWWECDKRNCRGINVRPVPEKHTITWDSCDLCKSRIYEPLFYVYDPENVKPNLEP